jgi:hypothetical protein
MTATVHTANPTTNLTANPTANPTTGLAVRSERTSPTERLAAIAAAVGPLVLVASSLAWLAGDEYAELRAILSFWAFPAIALGLIGIATRLERSAPRSRALVTALVTIGAVAGGAFAQEIAMVDFFGTERLIRQDTPSAMLSLGLPGLMFPAGVILTGLLAFRHRVLPRWQAALLAAGGALFPLSRMPELPALSVAADVLMVVALAPVAFAAGRD